MDQASVGVAMPDLLTFGIEVYVAGVAIGLLMFDASPTERLGLALLWPLGPLALAGTIAILIVAAGIAFPLFGGLLAVAAIGWWALT